MDQEQRKIEEIIKKQSQSFKQKQSQRQRQIQRQKKRQRQIQQEAQIQRLKQRQRQAGAKTKRKFYKWLIICIIACCICAYFVFNLYQFMNKHDKLEQKIQRIESKTGQIQEENNYLKNVTQNQRQDINVIKKYTEMLAAKIGKIEEEISYFKKITQNQAKIGKIEEEISQFKKIIQNQRQDINANKKYTDKLANQIIDLNTNKIAPAKIGKIEEAINQFKKITQNQRQDINANKKYTEKLANQIIDLNTNQLVQSEKSIQFLQKHSSPIKLQIQENVKSFKSNYKFNKKQQSIRKTTNQNGIIVYSLNPIPNESISYFKIKIEDTKQHMISIGVFTQEKLRNIDCGYCQSNQMYYIYCKDGSVYHGSNFFLKKSQKSRTSRINVGDIVSLFVDKKQNHLIWYVNEKSVFSQYIEENLVGKYLYPFVILDQLHDEVIILT